MKKITRISGVDCKIGRNSRTGSTISMIVPDEDIINVVSYFNDFKGGNEPTGKVKKIELVIYEDQDELETIESLRTEIKDMREFIENMDQVTQDADQSTNKIGSSGVSEPLEIEIVDNKEELSTNDQANEKPTINPYKELKALAIQRDFMSAENYEKRKEELKKTITILENENLPANQPDLKMETKKCECGSNCFIGGRCSNCGGVE